MMLLSREFDAIAPSNFPIDGQSARRTIQSTRVCNDHAAKSQAIANYSRHEQNFASGHVRGVLLQSAASFLQWNFCLEVGREIASQQFLDLAGKAQLSQKSS
jgi:hypothetical protein